MEKKARENLEAARRLLASDEDPCTNAATSRAYYAAYQACWTAMVDRAVLPEGYFHHDQFPSDLRQANVLTDDQAEDLVTLRDSRVTADYYLDDVMLETAAECVELAANLIVAILGAADGET